MNNIYIKIFSKIKTDAFKSFFTYFMSNISVALIPFIMLPILTRYLDPSDYGRVAIFTAFLSVITSISGMGLNSFITRKYYDNDKKEYEIANSISTGICIVAFNVFIILIILLSFYFLLGNSFIVDISFYYVLTACIAALFSNIVYARLSQWQVEKQPTKYAFLQVSQALINLLFSVSLVVFLKLNADGRVGAHFIAIILSGSMALFLLNKDNLLSLRNSSLKSIKEIYRFGLPMLPHFLGIFLISNVDKFIINPLLGIDKVGIYAVAAQLSGAMILIYDSLNKTILPVLFDNLSNDTNKEKIVSYSYMYILFTISTCLLFFIFGEVLIDLLAGEKYIEAGNVIGWLALGHAFGSVDQMFTNYIIYSKKTARLSFVTILSGTINCILMFIFIYNFGLLGAGYAFCLSMLLKMLMTWYYSNKSYPMPWFYFLKVNKDSL